MPGNGLWPEEIVPEEKTTSLPPSKEGGFPSGASPSPASCRSRCRERGGGSWKQCPTCSPSPRWQCHGVPVASVRCWGRGWWRVLGAGCQEGTKISLGRGEGAGWMRPHVPPLSPRGLEGGQGSATRSAGLCPVPPLGSAPGCPWGRGRGQTWQPRASPARPPTTPSSSGPASRAPSPPTTWPSATGTPFCWSRYWCPQPRHVPSPAGSLSPAPMRWGGRQPTFVLCATARRGAAAGTPAPWCQHPRVPSAPVPAPSSPQCQDPPDPSARIPMTPVPGSLFAWCQDPHDSSTRTPTSPVPGPWCPWCQDPHFMLFPSAAVGVPRCPLWHSSGAHEAGGVDGCQ